MRSRDLFEQIYREMISGRAAFTDTASGTPDTKSGAKPATVGRYQPVPDRTVIERVLQLANMRDRRDFIGVYAAFAVSGGTVEYAADATPPVILSFPDPEDGQKWQELYGPTFLEYQREQRELIAVLEAIRSDLSAARASVAQELSGRLEQIIVVTIPEFQGGQLLLDPYPFFPTIGTAWAYGAALLLDERRPAGEKRLFGERLRRCALGEDQAQTQPCGNWFLSYASTAGGPLPKYCSDECGYRAAEAAGGKRVRKHRAMRNARQSMRKN